MTLFVTKQLFYALPLKKGGTTNAANISELCWLQSGNWVCIQGIGWKGTDGRKTQEGREGETKPIVPHCYPNLYLTACELYIFFFCHLLNRYPSQTDIAKLLPGCSSTGAQLTVQECRALATASRGKALSRLQNFCKAGKEFTTCFRSRKPLASLLPRKAVSK